MDRTAEPVEFRFSLRSFPADVFANARLWMRDDVDKPCSFSKQNRI